jgi:hypothetical protein
MWDHIAISPERLFAEVIQATESSLGNWG